MAFPHVLASHLVNIYTCDLPSTISGKFAYADDLALLYFFRRGSHEMTTVSVYLQTWRLKLSYTKTVTATFHLNNLEANVSQRFITAITFYNYGIYHSNPIIIL